MSTVLSFDRPSSAHKWKTVDDVVMGGQSSSRVRWIRCDDESGALRFDGEVSLENNGGFCSTRNFGHWQLGRARELVWTLRGVERRFVATLRDETTPAGASFRHPFWPTGDKWQEVRLCLDDFRLFRRGKKLSSEARVDASHIESFGFLVADGRAGTFCLELKKLAVANHQR